MDKPDHFEGYFFRRTKVLRGREFVVKKKRFSVEQIVAVLKQWSFQGFVDT